MKGQNVVFSAANRSDAENSSDNWRTPQAIIDLCRRIFDGPIALDPCADSDPQYHFAEMNYTAEDNGLIQPWLARNLFLNMPYSQALTWNKRLIAHYKRGDIDEALVLMAARTDTAKWRTLADHAPIMCLVRGRIVFGDPRLFVTHCGIDQPREHGECELCGKSLSSSSAGFPSALFYLGYRMERFAAVIQEAELGQLWTPYALPHRGT